MLHSSLRLCRMINGLFQKHEREALSLVRSSRQTKQRREEGELELVWGRVAGLVLHLQTAEIYLALAGQKQGREHTKTQKEARYAAVSHLMSPLT